MIKVGKISIGITAAIGTIFLAIMSRRACSPIQKCINTILVRRMTVDRWWWRNHTIAHRRCGWPSGGIENIRRTKIGHKVRIRCEFIVIDIWWHRRLQIKTIFGDHMLAIDAIQYVCIAVAASDAIAIKHIMTIATTIHIILVVIV